jgi:ABC-2 type transport system permease protein
MKKEMRGYFNSWIGYVFLFILVGLVGVFFTLINLYSMSSAFQNALGNITILLLVIVPVLTMRLFAEEARQKTDQLLYTSPVSVTSIVFAKFLSAFALAVIGLLVTVIYCLMIMPYGTLPHAEIFTSYLGYTLLMSAFISLGMFVSACTESQIIAAIVTFFAMIFMYIMDSVADFISNTITSSSTGGTAALASLLFCAIVIGVLLYLIYDSTKHLYFTFFIGLVLLGVTVGLLVYDQTVFDGLLVNVIKWFSVLSRLANFDQGILNLADIVYYISFSGLFIYLSINAIEKRRWR